MLIRNNEARTNTIGGGRGGDMVVLKPGVNLIPDSLWNRVKNYSGVKRQLAARTEDDKPDLEEVSSSDVTAQEIAGADGTGRLTGGEHSSDADEPEKQTVELKQAGPGAMGMAAPLTDEEDAAAKDAAGSSSSSSESSSSSSSSSTEDLTGMTVAKAKEIIATTYDKALLEKWNEADSRTGIHDAIDKQLDLVDLGATKENPDGAPAEDDNASPA